MEDKVQPGGREEKREWLGWTLALGGFSLASLMVLVFLVQYALVIKTHYQVVSLKDKAHKLERERAVMLLKLQSLSSLEHIEQVATTRLGMSAPKQRQVLDLRKVQPVGQVAVGSMVKK